MWARGGDWQNRALEQRVCIYVKKIRGKKGPQLGKRSWTEREAGDAQGPQLSAALGGARESQSEPS